MKGKLVFKKIQSIAIITAVALLVTQTGSLLSNDKVFAFSGGDGTYQTPFLVSNCVDLQSIDTTDSSTKVFRLTGDIDCTGSAAWNGGLGFKPITDFAGYFDGQNHTINNLTIDRPGEDAVGIFSYLQTARVINLKIGSGTSITGQETVGSLAGHANTSILTGITSSAAVVGAESVGGIIGRTYGNNEDAVIKQSYFNGSVNAGAGSAGGIVGYAYIGFTINDSISQGTVVGGIAGGLLGKTEPGCSYQFIRSSISNSTVTGSSYAGGLVGEYRDLTCNNTQIINSVANGTVNGTGTKGGLIGRIYNANVVSNNSYYSGTVTGQNSCVGSFQDTGGGFSDPACPDLSTAASFEPFSQWDSSDIWQGAPPNVSLRLPVASETGSDPVTNLVLSNTNRTQVDYSFSAPNSFGTFGTDPQYSTQIKEAADSWDNPYDYNVNNTTSGSFGSLKLSTQYTVRTQVVTTYGGSAWVESSFTTPNATTYDISSCEQLMAYDDNSISTALDNIVLVNDIDCSGITNFEPIGTSSAWGNSSYRGTFDGQGYTIKNLTIDSADWSIGLFQKIYKGEFKNVSFSGGSVTGYGDVGVVAGELEETDMSNVHSDIDVTATGGTGAGGLAGYATNNNQNIDTVMEYVSSTGNVSAHSGQAGGLVGYMEAETGKTLTLRKSFATGNVTGTNSGNNNNLGGLVGRVAFGSDEDGIDQQLTIADSYATGNVTGGEYVGGLIGYVQPYNDDEYDSSFALTITRTYSSGNVTGDDYIGGLIGYVDPVDYNAYSYSLQDGFSTGSVTTSGGSSIGGLVGYYYEGDVPIASTNNFFNPGDALNCSSGSTLSGCTAIDLSAQPNYFKDNTTNAPFSVGGNTVWSFGSVWQTNPGALPTLMPGKGSPFISPDGTVIRVASVGCSEQESLYKNEPMLAVQDPAYSYPVGLAGFRLTGCRVGGRAQIYTTFTGSFDASSAVIRKFNARTNVYTTLTPANSGLVLSPSTLFGKPALQVAYKVTDGGVFDEDGLVNGRITDPVGIAQLVVGVPNTGFGGL